MSPNEIFLINYILYMVNSIIVIVTATYSLTPKYSRFKTVVIWVVAEGIGGTIKYFMPLHSNEDILLGVFNSVVWIVVSYVLCEENIIGCLLSYGCMTMIMSLESFLWQLTPCANDSNWEIGTTVNYIIGVPVLLIGCIFIIWGKRLLKERQFSIINTKLAVLVVSVATYYVIYTYVPVRLLAVFDGRYNTIFILEELISSAIFLVILAMIFKKGEENQQLERSKELELIREKEQEAYDMLIARTEHMEKIRHDFFGQLAVARHIVNQDKEKGIEMIKELEMRLGNM